MKISGRLVCSQEGWWMCGSAKHWHLALGLWQ